MGEEYKIRLKDNVKPWALCIARNMRQFPCAPKSRKDFNVCSFLE